MRQTLILTLWNTQINVRVNRVETRVYPLLGGCTGNSQKQVIRVADRVIMILPETAKILLMRMPNLKPRVEGAFYGFIQT
jgi:tRNA G37 N-methylase Trm5